MQYMSFDVAYFTTWPGILATAGLILLIVGLILFILSGKKDKVDKNQKDTDNSNVSNQDTEVKTETVVSTPEVPVQQQTETITDNVNVASNDVQTENSVQTVNTTPIENSVETVNATPIENSVETVNTTPIENATQVETPVQNVESTLPNVTADVVTPVTAVETPVQLEKTEMPVVENTIPSVDVTVPASTETPSVTVNNDVSKIPEQSQNTVSIYGGVSPQVTVAPEEAPRKAYGGADPLENTGALPRINTPVEATTQSVIEKPEVDNISAEQIPAVETPKIETPIINQNPNVIEIPTPTVSPVINANSNEVKPVSTSQATPSDAVETLEF